MRDDEKKTIIIIIITGLNDAKYEIFVNVVNAATRK